MTYLLIAIVALYYVLLVRSHVRPYLLLRVKSNLMKYLPMAALLITLPLTALASPPPAQAQIRLGIELPVPVEPYCPTTSPPALVRRTGTGCGGGSGNSSPVPGE